jgi:FtsP/CotA-like multicopper oxidase with cupredoxin domain/streptogramin lyase
MSTRKLFWPLIAVAGFLSDANPHTVLANTLHRVTNVSPNPQLTNEFYLTATNVITHIDGRAVKVMVYKDDPPGGGGAPAQIPSPVIEATVGQTIICHFKNALTNNIEGASIHWHGIELDNDSDGTGVTQDTIFNGQTYTYKFIVPRSGLYWYHSHMLPGTTTFSGMYGAMLVHDTNETALIAAGVLPPTNRTFQLLMSDISFTNGVVGKMLNGTNFSLNSLIQMCENSVLGGPNAYGPACGAAGTPGDIFLCNGDVPSRGGTFCAPIMDSIPFFFIGKNQRVRLQLFNASISRNCYLTLKFPCSNPTGNTNLYHIGGQGGLLDNAVLDGGVQNGYDFRYGKGTVNIGSGEREDVMFYSSGNVGDVIQLLGYPPGAPWKLSGSNLGTNYPVAFFIITNGGSADAVLAAGSPILTAVGVTNENLRLQNTNSVAPPPLASLGSQTGFIKLQNHQPTNGISAGPNIGNYAATELDGNSGNGSWPEVPHPPSAVWAHAGDVLQLAIANETDAVHPYHLHGFSMQPIAIYSANLQTNLYNFPYNQFVDTWDIMPGEALVFRIKLEDRAVLADTATGGPLTLGMDSPRGGNLGRWLMHCHIFLHGAVGMISELVVLPNTATRLVGPASGTNSVTLVSGSGVPPWTGTAFPWTATAKAPWLHLAPGYASGKGSTNVIFSFDANPGATRVGEMNVGGETVVVTQAGTNYVKAPGPVTTLATNLLGPTGIAADREGNVYFCDGNHHALKRWNRSNNTVTTLASGFGTLQGLGMDGLGNVYFADFDSTAIRMWSASTHLVTTVFNNNSTGVSGLAVDDAGNVYISVPVQRAVKKWTASTGTLSTFITDGLNEFFGPYGVAVDRAGGVYIADSADDAVKKFEISTVIILGTPIPVGFWRTIVSSNHLDSPWDLAVDDGGNIYIADGFHNAIKKWNAASNTVETLVSSGLSGPTGVAVDRAGNIYISDFDHNAIKELPHAYVDPTPQQEPAEATQDSLPVILPPTENLLPPFAPVSSQSWISYNGSANGIVNFGVEANRGNLRAGTLSVLGQAITIKQAGFSEAGGTTNAPTIINASMPANGVFQFSFTNGTPGVSYTVLFSTNVATPLSNWSVLGSVAQVGENLWRFTDTRATNDTGFYAIRSP